MSASKPRVTVVSFIGRPFAGKDFQAGRFKDTHQGVSVISTGALLRDRDLLSRSFSPEEISYIDTTRNTGGNVKPEIVERLAHEAILEKAREGNKLIILTGHPRMAHQLKDMIDWTKSQRESGEFDIHRATVIFGIRKGRANLRRAKRWEEEHRVDDGDLEAVARRHGEYRRNVLPLIPRMFLRGLLPNEERLHYIFADRSTDEVTKQLEKILRPYLPKKKSVEGQAARKEN